MLISYIFLWRNLVDTHQRDLRPREPIYKSLCLDLGLVFRQRVRVGGVDGVLFVDGEIFEFERLVGVRESDCIDAGCVADFLDTEFAAGAEAVERTVDVVRVHLHAIINS